MLISDWVFTEMRIVKPPGVVVVGCPTRSRQIRGVALQATKQTTAQPTQKEEKQEKQELAKPVAQVHRLGISRHRMDGLEKITS